MAFIMTSAGAKANNGSATRGSVFSILGVVQHLYWTRNQQCDGRSHFSAQQAALPYRCLSGPFAETYSRLDLEPDLRLAEAQ